MSTMNMSRRGALLSVEYNANMKLKIQNYFVYVLINLLDLFTQLLLEVYLMELI